MGTWCFNILLFSLVFLCLKFSSIKPTKGKKRKERQFTFAEKTNANLHYGITLQNTLCIIHKSFLSPKQSGRQDKIVCQADFFLFPQISTRDKLLN